MSLRFLFLLWICWAGFGVTPASAQSAPRAPASGVLAPPGPAAVAAAARSRWDPNSGINFQELSLAFKESRFDAVEQIYEAAKRRGENQPNGTTVATLLLGMSTYEVLPYLAASAARRPEDDKLDEWLRAQPGSALARMAKARMLISRAAALDEDKADWKVVDQLLAAAYKLLDESRASSRKEGLWHIEMLKLARLQGWSAARVVEAVKAAAEADPYSLPFGRGYYDIALEALPVHMEGYPAQVEWLARSAVERTRERDGTSMYARVYISARLNVTRGLFYPFVPGGADWLLLHQSFRDLYTRTPNPRDLNMWASFACVAGDKLATAALVAQIGGKPMNEFWTALRHSWFPECKAWAEGAPQPPKRPPLPSQMT